MEQALSAIFYALLIMLLYFASATEHAFKNILTSLPKPGGGEYGKFYSLPALNDPRIGNFSAYILINIPSLRFGCCQLTCLIVLCVLSVILAICVKLLNMPLVPHFQPT